MLLLIDNYDSFTYNLYQYIGQFYKNIKVVRNDEVCVNDLAKMNIRGIILSPGPGRPEDAGITVDVIKEYGDKIPILGICLGHQAIGYAFGAKIMGAKTIMHGKMSEICHDESDLFKGIKNMIKVMRYHSLVIDKQSLSKDLTVTAQTEDGVIMGIKHKKYPIYGLQFHPESIFTEHGREMIKNFVEGICYAK